MKKIITAAVFVVGLILGYVASFVAFPRPAEAPGGPSQIEGHIVLFHKYEDGSMRETGIRVPYDVTGTFTGAAALLLSPDQARVVYSKWVDARIELFVANIDGSNTKRIAVQTVPEGSGSLDASSIRWSEDSAHILYTESGGARCPKAYCANPGEFVQEPPVKYSVDVTSGEKSVVPSN